MSRSVIIGTMIGAAILIGGYAAIQGGGEQPPGDPVANLWVDDDGGTCTRQAIPAVYSDAAACADLSDAEAVDVVGDLVMVRCDEESTCTINSSTGDTLSSVNSGWITYRGQTGYTVTFGSWDPTTTPTKSLNVTGTKIKVENLTAPWLYADGTDNVFYKVKGSSYDFVGDREAMIQGDWSYLGNCGGTPTPQGVYHNNTNGDYITKDTRFHDNSEAACGGLHLDCWQTSKNASLWITGNTFGPSCGTGDGTIIGDDATGANNLANGRMENNYWYSTTDGAEINFSGAAGSACSNWTLRFNTIAPKLDYSFPIFVGNACLANRTYGNIYSHADSFICSNMPTGANYFMHMSGSGQPCPGANSFLATPSGSTCCASDAQLDAQFVDAPTDTHLISGSDAIDAGSTTCPDGDIDGYVRSGTCDIGADEFNNSGNGNAPDWYVDDAGSDSNICTPDFPCLTLDRAYDMAQPGDTIGMMSGTYASQTITGDFSKNQTTHIVIQPAPGQSPVITTTLTLDGADHLTVKNITTDRWVLDNSADDVIMENIDTDVFTIFKTNGALVKGGDVGPYDAFDIGGVEDTQLGGGFDTPTGCAGNTAPAGNGTTCTQDIKNLTIDGVTFHDYTDVNVPSAHTDCLQFYEGQNVVIQNNKFDDNCGESNDIYIRGDAGAIDGFMIQNNWFERTAEDFSLRLSGQSCPQNDASSCTPPCKDVTIRNNTFKKRVGTDCNVLGTGIIRGNINLGSNSFHCSSNSPPDVWGTSAGWDYDYNVVGSAGTKCDASTDIQSDVSFVSTTNLHLSGSNAGADNAVPTPFSPQDIDGDNRPANSQADAGADERNQ